ncbi:MAG: hypothetical protein ABWZ87_01380 [Aeromicrobium sp.]
MRRLRTNASRWAAAACLALGALYVFGMVDADSVVFVLLAAVMATIAVAAAVKMWLHNCFESHLAAWALVAATVGSSLLALTVGIPGEGAAELSVVRVALLVLSGAVALLLVQDGRVRRKHARPARRPYAR